MRARKFDLPKAKIMFTDSEKWRKEFNVDELYRTFDYKEKEEVDKVYPQFYHKTDKVRRRRFSHVVPAERRGRTVDRSTSNSSATST